MPSTRIYIVDAFADRPFTGNPAAICLLDEPRDVGWMQSTAAEMNLSETAFVRTRADGFDLRWFTPAIEVALCGHATLAAAHVLWTENVATGPIRFHTKSGVLTCRQTEDLIELDFPSTPPRECEPPPGLIVALGLKPSFVGESPFDKLILVDAEETIRSLQPDFAKLREFDIRGVMVTSVSADPAFDFVSRYFAPRAGIDEDPVTGSAHCCLAPFWSGRLNKRQLTAFQASSRGGVIQVRVDGDRVHLGGRAITVLRGHLVVALN